MLAGAEALVMITRSKLTWSFIQLLKSLLLELNVVPWEICNSLESRPPRNNSCQSGAAAPSDFVTVCYIVGLDLPPLKQSLQSISFNILLILAWRNSSVVKEHILVL